MTEEQLKEIEAQCNNHPVDVYPGWTTIHELLAEVKRLREFQPYVRHTRECVLDWDERGCTCGLAEIEKVGHQ